MKKIIVFLVILIAIFVTINKDVPTPPKEVLVMEVRGFPIVIPKSAVSAEKIFVLKDDNIITRMVKPIEWRELYYQIKDGLEVGDIIFLEGFPGENYTTKSIN